MNDYQRLLYEIADIRNKMASMIRVGTVDEVKADKLRVNFGNDNDGKKVLSPWLHHSNHRGGTRERRFFSDDKSGANSGQGGGSSGGGGGGGGGQQNGGGQNVTVIMPFGDPAQAFIVPFSPNKGHPPPPHANKTGKGEETWYHPEEQSSGGQGGGQGGQGGGGGKLANAYSRGHDGYDWWLQDHEEQEWNGNKYEEGGEQKRNTAGDKAKMKIRYHKEGGITGRVGKDVRYAAHEKGAKIKAGDDNFAVVQKDGKSHNKAKEEWVVETETVYVTVKKDPFVSKPWKLRDKPAKDSIPDDNE